MGFYDPEALIASAAAQEAEAVLRRSPPAAQMPIVNVVDIATTAPAASTQAA